MGIFNKHLLLPYRADLQIPEFFEMAIKKRFDHRSTRFLRGVRSMNKEFQ